MKKRKLGNNGFELSEVGLGCWQIGGDWGSGINKTKAFEILNTAVKNGITFFDTADVYGDGKSEKIIGEFLQSTDVKIKVATKFGRKSGIFPDNYTEKGLRECVDSSLNNLQIKTIDLLQLHCIPTEVLRKGAVFTWLRKLQQEGKITHFGASVETVEEGLLCLQQEGLQSLQVIYNIFRQKLTTELLPKAFEKGVGVIVRLPLASGLLSGKFTAETTFDKSDHRNFNNNGQCFNVGETFAGLPFETGVHLSNELKNYCPEDLNMVQMSLRWLLDHKEITTIIPGASSPAQVISNASTSALTSLSSELKNKLQKFYTDSVHDKIRGNY